MLSRSKSIFIVIVLAVFFVTGAVFAAWRDAPAGPPNYGAVSPDTQDDYKPMSLGLTTQTKSGGANFATSTTTKVGIGGIPVGTAKLSVKGESTGDAVAVYTDTANSALYLEQSNSAGYTIYATGTKNYFSGNVGIGTESPGAKLELAGDGAGSSPAKIILRETPSGLGALFLNSARVGSGNRLDIGEGSNTFLTIRSDDDDGGTTSRGNVGIGTTGPSYKLDVTGDVNITGTYRVNGTAISTGGGLTGSGTGGYLPKWTGMGASTALGNSLISDDGSSVSVAGSVTASAFYVLSDARLKKNVKTLSGALEKIQRVRGVSYDLVNGTSTRQIGVIAQELEQEFPELVVIDGNGYKAVAYDRLSAVLIEAVKELQAQNQTLQSRLDLLEKKW